MFTLTLSPATFIKTFESTEISRSTASVVVCAAKGPRPRYPRVWKTNKKFGTISKSIKLVECIKELSNVKEEVYGALDSFIAWELEFPLITVKKAMKVLENEREWKRIIQVTKWMLSKGQGKTMGSYFALLTALAADGRIDEAEELWTKLFSEHLESMPRIFFDKMVSIYYKNGMHEKMFEIFADMEELGVRPNVSVVKMVGDVFRKMDMMDKYIKLNKKYPPPKWEYRYIKGKRCRVQAKRLAEFDSRSKTDKANKDEDSAEKTSHNTSLLCEESEAEFDNRSSTYYANKDDTAGEGYNDFAGVTSHKTNLMFEEIETEFDNRSSTDYSNKDYTADLACEESETSSNELYDETSLPA